MIKLDGYGVREPLYKGSRTQVYRGYRESDQTPVIIKVLKSEYPNFSQLVQFRNQYTIGKSLSVPGIVPPLSLETFGNGYALIMLDQGKISLKEEMKHWLGGMARTEEGLREFFAIALQLAQILEGLYHHRVIHKDIKPQNIVIHPTTREIQLIDFSIASILPKGVQEIQNPNVLEGTLAYMSPEQTGRMNRGIDYRTDFYSLGVTFYELLTGQLPFSASDPMELVHCQLSRQPRSLIEHLPTLPQSLNNIVLKLMAKTAENRYQSAYGLKYDLELCQTLWEGKASTVVFELGTQDISDHFTIPEKLYGREREVATLLAAFERVAQGMGEMMLVSGFSGIGKTVVVQEIHKPIVRQRGYFISGKFDQLKRDIPFLAFVQAFQTLIQQLLTESQTQVEHWKHKILSALGENAQVIVDVIPELELLIGQQSSVPRLEPTATQNRFKILFSEFIQVFTTLEHPLVIFLDDLQWADSASLGLIQLLMSATNTAYLLIIGAYRDNEVSPTHPLMLMLEELQNRGVALNTLHLEPLNLGDLNCLVADTLSCSLNRVLPLTELVYQKTQGNPFFTHQFLKFLYENGMIHYSREMRHWQCNFTSVKSAAISSDVVEFMATQLQRLSSETLKVLQLAACIGNVFDLNTLAVVCEQSLPETARYLWQALQSGLILPLDEVYKLFIDENSEEKAHLNSVAEQTSRYKFLHDRVQQAAYSLIPDAEKQLTHVKIGQLLLNTISGEKQEEKIFDLVNQLNLGVGAIESQAERLNLAQLNLLAAQKAKTSAAYGIALQYLRMGINLLHSECWQENYDLTLNLYEECAEIEYLNGNFEESEKLIYIALTSVKSKVKQAEIYNLLLIQYTLRGQYEKVIQVGQQALQILGINISGINIQDALKAELEEIRNSLKNQEISSLISLPEMENSSYRVAMKLLTNIEPSCYFAQPELWSITVTKMVNLSLKSGNMAESSFGYALYGMLLIVQLQDYQPGYQFIELALKVSDRFGSKAYKCRSLTALVSTINHWVNPIKTVYSIGLEGYQIGLEVGEIQYSGYILAYQLIALFSGGEILEKIHKNLTQYLTFIENSNNQLATDILFGIQILVQKWIKGDERENKLQEAEYLSRCKANKTLMGICFYQIYKSQFLLIHHHPLEALQTLLETQTLLSFIPGFIAIADYNLIYSLTLTNLYLSVDQKQQQKYWKQIKLNQTQMQVWVENCSANFRHKDLMVQAEMARIKGKYWEAVELYDRAIATAKEQGFAQDEALANELAAQFWQSQNKEKIALTYLIEAYYAYGRWGATAKLKELEKQYPQLLNHFLQPEKMSWTTQVAMTTSPTSVQPSYTTSGGGISSSTNLSEILDLAAVIKASQALSSQIQLEKLLSNLMEILLENAGASKSALILKEEQQFNVVAIATNSTEPGQSIKTILPLTPLESSADVPHSVINYVYRSSEALVLNEVKEQSFLAVDSYILQQHPKSILCTPIINQGQLIGIFYLENQFISGAFTRNRVELLNIISTQAAISLQNALLYRNLSVTKQQLEEYNQTLEQRVQARTQELNEKNTELGKTLEELKRTQTQLIQTEKMSSLGQMVAGVAHEINNPVNFIYGNINHANSYIEELLNLINLYQSEYPKPTSKIKKCIEEIDLEFLTEDLQKLLQSMKMGSERIRNIVLSLRNFSRLDEAAMKPVDIHEGIESTLLILQNRLKKHGDRPTIELVKDYGNLPLINCYASELNQVFMNLLANACDALNEAEAKWNNSGDSPQILIKTEITSPHSVQIKIRDNANGIPKETQAKIFDPFFTTKPIGSGTGLGLSISYFIIVEKHGGNLICNSILGEGTEFMIEIPLTK